MLTYEWGDTFQDDPEVCDLLEASAAFDLEQGFSTAPPQAALDDASAVIHTRELVTRMSPNVGSVVGSASTVVVAYLRLTVDESGTGTVEFTVHPDFRSLGIGTLLFEKLGLQTASESGWAGTGANRLRIWARGSHPAADRMAMRFDASVERVLWRLIRPLVARDPVPSLDAIADVQVGPMRPDSDIGSLAQLAGATEVGFNSKRALDVLVARDRTGVVIGFVEIATTPLDGDANGWLGGVRTPILGSSANRAAVNRALLGAALRHLAEAGLSEVEIYVEAASRDLIRACRSVGFRHDQTDCCYRIPKQYDSA